MYTYIIFRYIYLHRVTVKINKVYNPEEELGEMPSL